jgi:hypothetical protein
MLAPVRSLMTRAGRCMGWAGDVEPFDGRILPSAAGAVAEGKPGATIWSTRVPTRLDPEVSSCLRLASNGRSPRLCSVA